MHPILVRALLLLVSVLASTHYALSATGKAGLGATSRYQAPEIDRAFADLVAKHEINTAGVAVIKRGEVVWQNHYGEQSPGMPASERTLFDVASLTKTVTAETILRLVAAGKLSLDEPVSRYWVDPDLEGDPRHHKLTARLALTHTTGFMNWRFFTADRKLRFMHDPGTQFGYSGEGFEYVARYAEKKLGIPFEELADAYVFKPVGMDDVSLSVREANFPRIARPQDADGKFYGYYCRPEGWCRSEGEFAAAGSMVVTVGDYARFMISSMRGVGLNAQLVKDRGTIQGLQDDIDCTKSPDAECPVRVGYGLGWSTIDLGDDRLIGHRGSDWSVVSLAYYYQGSGDGLVIFFNAPNKAGIAAMVEALELLDPGSPELHGYRARRARVDE